MRKIISFILALTMCLSLCACSSDGSNDTSKEELLQSAAEITRNELYEARIFENVLKGDDYLNNTYTYKNIVRSIDPEYVTMASVTNDNIVFKVYLDREELKTLNVGEQITVVGIIDSIEKQDNLTAVVTMKTAYFVTNRSTIAGKINDITAFNDEPYCLMNGVVAAFLDEEVIETLKEGKEITVDGVLTQWTGLDISRPYKYEMRDAKLVE